VLGAAGLHEAQALKPWFILKRVSAMDVKSYGDIYPQMESGGLLSESVSGPMARAWQAANAQRF